MKSNTPKYKTIKMNLKDDFSKSELFELSAEFSNDSSQLDDGTFAFSNLELDDDLNAFKQKSNQKKRQLYENKQLQHDLQLIKIDLAQRDFQLNNLRMEYQQKIESIEEKCSDLSYQNQILNARLNSTVAIHQEEDKQKGEHVKLELSRILARQKELEENNERFMKNEHEIKKEIRTIDTIIWSNEEYEFMSRRDEDLLTIREFTALKLHNSLRPLKIKYEESLKKEKSIEDEFKLIKMELHKLKKIYDEERKNHNVNTNDNQKLCYELADTKALLQQANFKRDGYDRVKYEKDDFERRHSESETKNASYQATLQVINKERDDLIRNSDQLKQEISLLRQDKDYLQKQFVDTQSRFKITEDKLEQTQKFYDEVKLSKEELHEKFMNARESYKTEYESKLTHDLDDLKLQTNQEIEKLRMSTKEFYEREIRMLKENREQAFQDKEKHELNEKEINMKYQEAVNELRIIQISCEHKVSELKSELKLKNFEVERSGMLNEDNIANYQKVLVENEKLHKKIEIIQNEYYGLQVQNDKRFLEFEYDLNEKKMRLESYEKVENEMDQVIRQVAESTENGEIDEAEAEKMLLSYGYGSNIVLNSKRKIQQNVHLTKRILHLEQLNTTMRCELNKERANYKELIDQLDVAKNVIENTKQPHEFLVRSMQSKELQLKKQQASIASMQKRIEDLSSDKENCLRKQNDMTADIEKLIRHNEELLTIKQDLKTKGLVNNNNRFLNSNTNFNNKMLSGDHHHQSGDYTSSSKPLLFTSKVNRFNQSVGGVNQQRKSPSPNRKKAYAIQRN